MTHYTMLIYFALALVASGFVTWITRQIALKLRIVDLPDGDRKRHAEAVPLLGGGAIFLVFWSLVLFLVWYHPLFGIELIKSKLYAAFFASIIILLIGVADDLCPYSPKLRLGLSAIAVVAAVGLGITLDKVTNPLGGFFNLSLTLGTVVAFVWLMGMMYTTKILDGLDGLSSGVVTIGALMIFLLTQSQAFYQPNVALVSLIFAGVMLGFWFWNFFPAKIFLGEAGSLLIGFTLGVLAIISGGKLATALLVMAVPALDVARVIFIRIKRGGSAFKGDRLHLHFQLIQFGLSERQVVLLFYVVAAAFGATTLVLESLQKIVALVLLALVTVALMWKLEHKKNISTKV